ncbi:MAG: TPM domain-containing protein [Lachnospiraceae bacterium]|nr:TPM domain-containing protein [Lachnospiraceae bacterium]
MRNILKKSLGFIILITVFTGLCGYTTEHDKVYDEAGLFSQSEISSLTDMAERYGNEVKLDLVVYTVDEYISKSVMETADDFYDDNNFGWDDCDGSGAILLIDMYKRELWLSCAGLAQAYVDEYTEDKILDNIEKYAADGDFYGAATAFMEGVYDAALDFRKDSDYKEILDNWYEGKYDTYDDIASMVEPKEPNFFTSFKNPLLSMGIGAVCAGIVVGIMCIHSKTRMTVGSRTYIGNQNFPVRQDNYIRTTTTSRVIQSSSGGSSGGSSHSHHSSSGRSHSGGGRHF